MGTILALFSLRSTVWGGEPYSTHFFARKMRCRKFNIKSIHWCWLPSFQDILSQTFSRYISFHYVKTTALIDLSCSYKCLGLLYFRTCTLVCCVEGKKENVFDVLWHNRIGSYMMLGEKEGNLKYFIVLIIDGPFFFCNLLLGFLPK